MWKNICVLVIVGIVPIFAATTNLQPPVIKVYEVDEGNTILREYDRVDKTRSEIIVEGVDHLRLECKASYPVQWIYTGNGMPILSSKIAMTTSGERGKTVNMYTTSAFLSPLQEYHTGSYQCSHTDYLSLSPNLYVYVPGPTIFTSLVGQTVQIPKNDSNILIPCSVSHPKVQVSLDETAAENKIEAARFTDNPGRPGKSQVRLVDLAPQNRGRNPVRVCERRKRWLTCWHICQK
jgi:hypothetical protein